VAKFLIDDFIKNYQSSLNIVRVHPMGVTVPAPAPPDLIPWLREKMHDKVETCDRIYSQKKEDLAKCVGDVSGSPIPP
jgi:hypothetical protein